VRHIHPAIFKIKRACVVGFNLAHSFCS
jgi:hypothetical protein